MTTQERKILHCDCNGFYASVELLSYPELKDKPVIVGGSAQTRHGIVLAKNEKAKQYGIKTAETIFSAQSKCPDVIILPPHSEKYSRYSKIINEIYSHYTDLVEPFGIDESWLDVTNSYHLFAKDAKQLADMIRERVYYETGLTISVGVSFNKIFAKLGSDYKKPNATTVISKDNFRDIVFPLKVQELIYVGKSTQKVLNDMGVFTIGELAAKPQELLKQRFGKHGEDLYLFANGLEQSPVLSYNSKKEHKSVGSGNTFYRNLLGLEDIKPAVMVLSEEVGQRLRRYAVFANGVQIMIKDPQFKSFTRQCRIPSTNITDNIYKTALNLIIENWDVKKEIRAITVTAIEISENKENIQTTLFDTSQSQDNPKQEKLQQTLDKIKSRYGENAVKNAAVMKTDLFK